MSEHSHLMDDNYRTKLDGISEQCEFYCFQCNKPQLSRIEYTNSQSTYIWCCILCFLTIIFGLLPLCLKKCKSKTHYCPECDKRVGFTEGEFC